MLQTTCHCNPTRILNRPKANQLALSLAALAAFFALTSGMAIAQETVQRDGTTVDVQQTKIVELLTAQTKAWNEGNLTKFMDTYWKSDRLTFSSGGKTTRGWQATLDRYKEKYSTREKMGQLRFDNLEVTQLEANSALVLGNWYLTFPSNIDQAERVAQGNFSLVLSRIDLQWKIIHDHSSIIAP